MGVPIVFLSACLAIPPLYAVTLAVPATRMSVIPFGVAVLLGRMVLFLAIAFGSRHWSTEWVQDHVWKSRKGNRDEVIAEGIT